MDITNKSWNEESMNMALRDIKQNDTSVRMASVIYVIPRTTLRDRISSNITLGEESCMQHESRKKTNIM